MADDDGGTVDRATEAFQRELAAERNLIDAKISALRELHESRLQGLADSIAWRDEVAVRIRQELADAIADLKLLHDKDLAHVNTRFTERDRRFDREADTAQNAVQTALTSARELVTQQTNADAVSAQETKTAFTKQIDAIDKRVDELKERLVEVTSTTVGVQSERTEHRLGQGAIVSLIVAGIASIGLIITIVTLILKR